MGETLSHVYTLSSFSIGGGSLLPVLFYSSHCESSPAYVLRQLQTTPVLISESPQSNKFCSCQSKVKEGNSVVNFETQTHSYLKFCSLFLPLYWNDIPETQILMVSALRTLNPWTSFTNATISQNWNLSPSSSYIYQFRHRTIIHLNQRYLFSIWATSLPWT